MEQKTKSPKMLRQRKMLLVLPLLVLPFVTALFWALGGGKFDASKEQKTEKKGFNLKLPDANLKEGQALDKMNYYDQAALDSIKLKELIEKDPNYLGQNFIEDSIPIASDVPSAGSDFNNSSKGLKSTINRDLNEEKVRKKLEALQKVIANPVVSTNENLDSDTYESINTGPTSSSEVDRLEEMMQSVNTTSGDQDPELQQLSGMLESILDIQHPDRVQEKIRKASETNRGQVFSISTTYDENVISSLEKPYPRPSGVERQSSLNGFYSLDENEVSDAVQNAVEAVVHETQTIVNGSTVKLRLSNAIFINGVKIPKNHFVFGVASLKGERLAITIDNLRYNNALFPVDLSVFDLDGLSGIYIPGAINRDVAKASADRSMQTLGVASLDDSWGAQAAGAGIEAAKNLLSKKVKLVKVVVKSGYKVLLYDEKQQQQKSN
ncbi:conjugative transposon protein TraM [Flavobacterium turcicum]|uniref:Conjugative transposon protein TraM n=1 Tax=Flavobacterium turcicum TaxID=2764718 RepID=A0ABR7JEH3_9FLAO|nr:conjugative transposon protein TraM [Flavobacterium turcicum]MBC5862875.1 conjugative transposon protein TraM [Flavobacterium turcicum]NHL01607.1 conjugative transposon protein TraM [Flavobacterium turcicum]